MKVFLILVAVLASLVAAAQAPAITGGGPDAGAHPQVGIMVVNSSNLGRGYGCSGTLISPTVFLTAAHCDPSLLRVVHVTRLWAYFADQLGDPNAIPMQDLVEGTFVADPQFQPNPGGEEGSIDSHDIAVILLDSPVTITPASLPAADLLDQLASKGGLLGQSFTNVGYGATGYEFGGGPPRKDYPGARLASVSDFQALLPSYLYMLGGTALDTGGTCGGDSGGPAFLGTSTTVVAITSTGDPFCRALNVDYRTDTTSARSFLSHYLQLP